MTRPQKYRDVARFLRGQGWEKTRQRGSHEIWQPSGGGQTFSLPQHGGQVSSGIVKHLQRIFPDTPDAWN